MTTNERLPPTVEFVQRAQALAPLFRTYEPLEQFTAVWKWLSSLPACTAEGERVLVAQIVDRVAGELLQAPHGDRDVPRLQRRRVSEVHASRALDYIRRHVAEHELSLARVADACRLTGPYLSHTIVVETGYKFGVHRSGIRVLYAASLLKRPLSVKEVAAASGYGRTPDLDRAFRHWIAMTPTEYRGCVR